MSSIDRAKKQFKAVKVKPSEPDKARKTFESSLPSKITTKVTPEAIYLSLRGFTP